jgi:hypothetical protein
MSQQTPLILAGLRVMGMGQLIAGPGAAAESGRAQGHWTKFSAG